LDPAVDSIIMKASARDPAQRFQSCDEFAAALEAWERTGSAVSVPPEQSLEAIFAASVPRASAPGVGSTDDTISADTGRRSVSKVSVGGGAAPARSATPASSTPPREPTVNTWASSSQTGAPQKLGAPILAATAAGFLLLAGAGIGAYVFFKSPSPTVPTPSARTAATAPLPPSEPSTAVEQVPPPAESVATKAPEVAPTTTATAAPPATTTAHVTAKPVVPHHKPTDKTQKPEPPPKPKPGINFGY
jgi:hypothetical protein